MKTKSIFGVFVFISAISFTSCKKSELNGSMEGPSNNGYAMIKQVPGTVFTCPNSIAINGNGKNGGFVKTTIPTPLPYMVKIAGTSDIRKPSANGLWLSSDKYFSTTVSLIYLDAQGNNVCNCSYDSNGSLQKLADFIVIFNPIMWSLEGYNVVAFSINAVPSDLVSFDIERSSSASGTFTKIFTQYYTGESDYQVADFSPLLDSSGAVLFNNYYRVVAKDEAGNVLGYTIIRNAIPGGY